MGLVVIPRQFFPKSLSKMQQKPSRALKDAKLGETPGFSHSGLILQPFRPQMAGLFWQTKYATAVTDGKVMANVELYSMVGPRGSA